MRPIILILLISLLPSTIFAKNEIEFGQQSSIDITSKVKVFKPAKGFREINDVLYIDHLFYENGKRLLQINTRDSIVWTKFTIRNTNKYPINLLLEYRNPNIQEIQFFIKKDFLLIHKRESGTRFPFSTREIKSRFFVKQLMLEPGVKYTIFARIKNHMNKVKIPIKVYDQHGFNLSTSSDNLQAGLLYGILITLMLTGLLFLILKFQIRIQLFYMFYMLAFITLFFMMDGYALQYIFYDKPYITSYIIKIFPFIIVALFALLSQHYFKLIADTLTFNRIISGFIIANIILFSISALFQFNIQVTMLLILLVSISLISYLLFYGSTLHVKDPSYQYFRWAIILSLAIVLLFGVQHYTTDYGYETYHIFIKFSVILQLSLISLSLYKRLQLNHESTQKANIENLQKLNEVIEEQNSILEQKVNERTQTLELKNAELEEHIAENMAITEELHKKRDEMENLNKELESAFKKSSADHIKLHKAMMQNETQQKKLEQSFKEISEKNEKLEIQNEEIQSQRDKIQEQHHLLELRNRDITDSIIYAERIQHSILPPVQSVQESFPNSFIYLNPKERLSGDFYWHEQVDLDNQSIKVISAIDCTGHGIPGAMMSIIAKDSLSEVVLGRGIYEPGKILNHINDSVIKTLNKASDENNAKDGMDMALITVNEEKKEIKFAGARNPLYLFRNKELTEYKGSIFSVGNMDTEDIKVQFNTITIPYQTNDTIYMFSDGMADQFGGRQGKKFRYSRFRNMLQQICDLPMEDQKKRIAQIFTKWKNDFEQIDDVLIIGVKL
jgi:serine phosphatase RsbU (regulator of sigma subunit)